MKNPTIVILSDLEIKLLEQEIKRAKLSVVARPLTKEEEKAIDQVIKDNSSSVAQSSFCGALLRLETL